VTASSCFLDVFHVKQRGTFFIIAESHRDSFGLVLPSSAAQSACSGSWKLKVCHTLMTKTTSLRLQSKRLDHETNGQNGFRPCVF
jgi:hypothetical protein